MKTDKAIVCGAVALASAWMLQAAEPVLSDVAVAQDPTNGLLEVAYTLTGAPAIVLVDIEKDGKSVGAMRPESFIGDVTAYSTQIVQPGTGRVAKWNPKLEYPALDGSVTAVVRAWPVDAPPDIMVLDLKTGAMQYFLSTNAVPGEGNVQNAAYKTDKMAFRRIPAGGVKWRMGASGKTSGEQTAHMVTLTKDFYLGIFECTQAQFGNLRPVKCATYTTQGALRPCDSVSYQMIRGTSAGIASWPNTTDPTAAHAVDEVSFFGRLRPLAKGACFDLPTEAQWEYACRGGSLNYYYAGSYSDTTAAKIARYGQNSGKIATGDKVPTDCDPSQATAIVGSYQPNAFGLYDMLGNVLERCLDRYVADLGTDDVTDPVGATAAAVPNAYVTRGGCWRDPFNYFSASTRGNTSCSDVYQSRGFRVALELGRTYACVNPSATVESTTIEVPVREPASVGRATAALASGEASVTVTALEARASTADVSAALEDFNSAKVGQVLILR